MKVAVLLTGQPRHLEQGAWWFKNKVFPQGCGIDVDYFGYFWDNGDSNLQSQIEQTYSPVRYHIQNYNSVINDFIDRVQEENTKLNWNSVPTKFKEVHLFGVDKKYISNYTKNIWGQYLCAGKIATMLRDLSDYDIVIRTRTDVAFNDMDIRFWKDAFANVHRNPIFDDKMLMPWLYVDSGIPLFSDFAFISKPHVWKQYNKNIEENCFKLATVDKALWYELEVSNFHHVPHWIWNKLAMYNKTNMLSFSVVWPMPFDCKLIRYDENVNDLNFDYINRRFAQYEQENPVKY
jgi:hypothetical protein